LIFGVGKSKLKLQMLRLLAGCIYDDSTAKAPVSICSSGDGRFLDWNAV